MLFKGKQGHMVTIQEKKGKYNDLEYDSDDDYVED